MKNLQNIFITSASLSITSMANATVNFYDSGNSTNYMFSISDDQSIMQLNNSYNDRISAVNIVGSGTQLFLFKDKNFTGRWAQVGNGNLNYYTFNDTASSIIATTRPVAYIFQHSGGLLMQAEIGGWGYPVTVGNIVPRLEDRNDEASSVTVPLGYCLKMWVNSPSADASSYNNWYLNPSYVTRGWTIYSPSSSQDLPSGIADEVSAVELVSCP
ncbi:MAG: hypothetical protein V4732_05375 [Pseudomonadota bacterium]